MQHPGATQSQVPRSAKTEWQSVRESHSADVVTAAQGLEAGHVPQATPSPGPAQPTNLWPPEQSGQYCGVQPLIALHKVSPKVSHVNSGTGTGHGPQPICSPGARQPA